MDDGEVELSDPAFLPNPSSSNNNHRDRGSASSSVDSIIEEFLKNTRTCTHTHTCNPPGPDDAAHTHTCYHTHTQVLSSGEDTQTHSSLKPRRPLGNREAVRKYREKKKAHTAYLEEEVKKLRVLNQHLVRKVQGQAMLEAEVLRLRALLANLRGKIDIELGSFPFQKHCSSNASVEETSLPCQTQVPCFHDQGNQSVAISNGGGEVGKAVFTWGGNCQPPIVDCHVNGNRMVGGGASDQPLEAVETLVSAKNQVQ